MAETLTELVAKISTDASELKRGLSEGERATEASSKKMSESLKKVGIAMAASGAAITAAMGFMGKAAIDEEINIKRLATTLGNVGVKYDDVKDSLEAVIATTQRKTGVADDEQRDILNRLILVTNDYNKALELLPTTLDLAAAGEMDAATAATYLGKAYLDLEKGADSVSVRFGQASLQFKNMEDIQNRVRGSAENLKNPLIGVKNAMSDIAETIGSALVPIITDLGDKIEAIAIKFQKWTSEHPVLAKNLTLVTTELGLLLLAVGSAILIVPKLVAGLAVLKVAFIALQASMGPVGIALLALGAVMALSIPIVENTIVSTNKLDLTIKNLGTTVEETTGKFDGLGKALSAQDRAINQYLPGLEKTVDAQEQVARSASEMEAAVNKSKVAIATATWTADGYTYKMSLFSQAEIDAAKASSKKIDKLMTQDEITKQSIISLSDYGATAEDVTNKINELANSVNQVSTTIDALENDLGDLFLTGEPYHGGITPREEEMNRGLIAERTPGLMSTLGITEEQAKLIAAQGISAREFEWFQDPKFVANLRDIISKYLIGDITADEFQDRIWNFDKGGIVPGSIGQPQLAMVHGGEKIIPANESIGSIVVNFTQPVFFDREDTMNRFVDMISKGIDRKYRLDGRR